LAPGNQETGKLTERPFTKLQPQDGDTILHCGHLENKPHHFLHFKDAVKFRRPDGSQDQAHWLVVCNTCFALHHENPFACISADSTWRGNEPAIRENFQ
jgi:hypothetical protein